MRDFLESLRYRKVMGIPLIAIILVVAAVALYAAIRMRGQSADADTDTEDSVEDADLESDVTGDSGGQPVFTAYPSPSVSQPSDDTTVIELSNDQWARKAVDWLVSQGADPGQASNAIDKYLSGETLSTREGELRDKAIRQFGVPPEGIIRTSTSTSYNGPASSQGVPPLTHKVRGKSDDQPAELARLYYGMATPDTIRLIKAANATVAVPYRPGQSVQIPKYRAPKYFKATKRVRTLPDIAAHNGITPGQVQTLNPGMKFPVKEGTRVRVK